MIDKLGDRIKENYENRAKTFLTRRTPVIIRIDGKAFHTFTTSFQKPFDPLLTKTMQDTMKYLCENIQGCVLGYTQSDEITLVLVDYKKLNSDAWFDYNVQKMCSVAASLATFAFNKFFNDNYLNDLASRNGELTKYSYAHDSARKKGAIFDARCFNVPKEEVCNALLFRQQDAERNSVSALARAYFSQKQLDSKSKKDKLMMLEEKGVVWGNLSTPEKRGSCCIKKTIRESLPSPMNTDPETGLSVVLSVAVFRGVTKWIIDENIPIFSENRAYIENLIKPEEE